MLPKARICEHLDPDTAAAEKAKAVEIFGSAMLGIHLNEDGSTGSRSSPGTPVPRRRPRRGPQGRRCLRPAPRAGPRRGHRMTIHTWNGLPGALVAWLIDALSTPASQRPANERLNPVTGFPAPLGPRTPKISPWRTCRSIPLTAQGWPKVLTRPEASTAAVAVMARTLGGPGFTAATRTTDPEGARYQGRDRDRCHRPVVASGNGAGNPRSPTVEIGGTPLTTARYGR
jgi:hypothetical protein